MSSVKNSLLILFFIFASTLAYQLIPHSSKIVYNFENNVELTDLSRKPSDKGSYITQGKLIVSSIWNDKESQLLKFELESLKLLLKSTNKKQKKDFSEKISTVLSKLNTQEFYLLLKNGIVNELLIDNKDKDVYLMNFKRGIASLFQFNPNDQTHTEMDLLGECNVLYHSKSSHKYQKTKTECRNWNLKINRRVENPIGVNLKSFQIIDYDLNNYLSRLLATETHHSYVTSKRDLGTKILSTILLDFVSTEDSVMQLKGSDANEVILLLSGHQKLVLEADIDGRVNKVDETLTQIIKSRKDDLLNYKIGEIKSADAFIKILPAARIAKTNEIVRILKSPSTQECRKQLLDLLGATQTIEAHRAVLEVVNFNNDDDFWEIERYLQAISISTRPNREILEDLYERLRNNKFKNNNLLDSLAQAVAAIASKYKHFSTRFEDDPLVLKIAEYMLYSLNSCKTNDCKVLYIRALQNLQNPSTKDTLMQIALVDGTAKVSVAALRALQNFNTNIFTEKNVIFFEKIFYQVPKKFDSTARVLALEILLSMKPSKYQLENLLKYLNSNDKSFEVKTYLIQRVRMMMEDCPRFRSLVRAILNENTDINNYHVLGQKGLTTVLERNLYSNPAFNESLISVQELSNGVLKQGLVDMVLRADSENFSTFKLGLYTQGLSSFVSSDNSAEEVDEDSATAGMDIMVQGVYFRPLVFFDGQSELMGHVWSGTASTPTQAYTATTVQQDHEEYILLQNGATIYLQVLGAKSIDLNGQVQLSLWNRNAHTLINQKSASKLIYSMVYGTSFLQFGNKIITEFEPEINVKGDLDFYSEIMLCIQLYKSDSILRQNIEKSLEVLGTNYRLTSFTKMKYIFPGVTLALNRKNNEMCNKLLH